MKKIATAMLLGAIGTTANAVEIDGSAGVVSNYVWRGATQSAGNPALQGYIGLTTEKGFYANAWGSQVDYDDDTTAEIDLTVGYSNDINDKVSYDVGYIKYTYTGDDLKIGDDIQEIYGTLSVGPVSGTVYRDIDNDSNYYSGSVSVSDIIDMPLDLSGFVGRNADSNMDAGIALGKDFNKVNVSYTWTWSEDDVDDSTHSVGVAYNF
jgi:uncharacterized protein (TIGR02001 family)